MAIESRHSYLCWKLEFTLFSKSKSSKKFPLFTELVPSYDRREPTLVYSGTGLQNFEIFPVLCSHGTM